MAECLGRKQKMCIRDRPNALAHATGMIQQKDMEKVGIIMGIIGLILGDVYKRQT